MHKSEITAVFLAAILLTGAVTAAIPSFVQDAVAESDKRDKKDRDRKDKDRYDDSYGDYKKEDRKYDSYGYDKEYNKYEEPKSYEEKGYGYDSYKKQYDSYKEPKSYDDYKNKYPMKEKEYSPYGGNDYSAYGQEYQKPPYKDKKSIEKDCEKCVNYFLDYSDGPKTTLLTLNLLIGALNEQGADLDEIEFDETEGVLSGPKSWEICEAFDKLLSQSLDKGQVIEEILLYIEEFVEEGNSVAQNGEIDSLELAKILATNIVICIAELQGIPLPIENGNIAMIESQSLALPTVDSESIMN